MILTMPPAVPLAAGPTCTHTCTVSVLLSFPRNNGEHTHASPSITIKEKLAEEFQRKHSQLWFKKTSFLLVLSLSLQCHFLCCPGGGSPGCRGVPRAAFQTNQLPQILWTQRAPGRAVARHQRTANCLEGRSAAVCWSCFSHAVNWTASEYPQTTFNGEIPWSQMILF